MADEKAQAGNRVKAGRSAKSNLKNLTQLAALYGCLVHPLLICNEAAVGGTSNFSPADTARTYKKAILVFPDWIHNLLKSSGNTKLGRCVRPESAPFPVS